MTWQSRHHGKTDEMFRELQAWCARMDAVGPTPRLVVDRDAPEGAIACFEGSEGGPTVRMHPEGYRRFRGWVDLLERFRLDA